MRTIFPLMVLAQASKVRDLHQTHFQESTFLKLLLDHNKTGTTIISN